MRVGGQHHAPAAFTPGKDPVPIVQEAGWASEPVSPPPGFDPRTFQPVASRYTDYAIPAPSNICILLFYICNTEHFNTIGVKSKRPFCASTFVTGWVIGVQTPVLSSKRVYPISGSFRFNKMNIPLQKRHKSISRYSDTPAKSAEVRTIRILQDRTHISSRYKVSDHRSKYSKNDLKVTRNVACV
jgi:hypothetical protein